MRRPAGVNSGSLAYRPVGNGEVVITGFITVGGVSVGDGRAGGYGVLGEWKYCGFGTSDDDNDADSSVVGNAEKANDRSKPI
jgi:hypothetical protein